VLDLADEDMTEVMAGAGEHGNAHGDDANIVLGAGGFGFARRLLRGGALGFEHVEADEQEDDAAGDLKRGMVMPKRRKMNWPAKAKDVRMMKA